MRQYLGTAGREAANSEGGDAATAGSYSNHSGTITNAPARCTTYPDTAGGDANTDTARCNTYTDTAGGDANTDTAGGDANTKPDPDPNTCPACLLGFTHLHW